MGAAFLAAPLHSAHAQAFEATSSTAPSGPALARIEDRLNQMDQQIRALTNKVEESQNTVAQLQKAQSAQSVAITRQMQDLDVRVNTLGGAPAAASSAATTTPPAAQSPAENPPPAPAPVENKAAVLDDASGSGSKDTPVTETAPVTTDPKAPIATAPTVKPLGEVKTDSAGTPAPAATAAASTGAQPGTPEAAYEKAFTLLKNQKYADAEAAFKAFLAANPKHDLAGNAQYWLGESYYGRKDYKNAAKAFAEGYQKYRRAPKAADNLLKLALSLEALGSKDDACVTLTQFKNEYKDAATSLKTKADAEIAKLACPAA